MSYHFTFFIAYSILVAIITNSINRRKHKKVFLFGATFFFYFICDARYLLLLLVSTVISFYCAKKMYSGNHRRNWFIFGIAQVILSLSFFKWNKFFPVIISTHISLDSLVMPLGISYYTFKIISYISDAYMGKVKPVNSFIDYFTYVAFFPQIICGPISRINDFGPQLDEMEHPSQEQIENGVQLVISGLFKKVVIADRISPYVDRVFASPGSYPSLALWIAAFMYTIEIYCDFAGYSEIVIGICNLMGIECKPNFKTPYFSYSINNFWQKWHISLSSWLRDYVYIPLGGSRKGTIRKKINILATFIVSGLWHGSGLTFLLWGLWHGVFSCVDVKKSSKKIVLIIQGIFTFFVIMIGWIMFRARNLEIAFKYLTGMFRGFSLKRESIIAAVMPMTDDYSCLAFCLISIALILILGYMETRDVEYEVISPKKTYVRTTLYIILIILFGTWGQNSFIYANF